MLHAITEGKPVKTPKEFMGVVEPSVVGRMRVFRWIGRWVAGAGWRQPVLVSKAIQRELNSPVLYLRAKLFLGHSLKVMRNWETLFTQR